VRPLAALAVVVVVTVVVVNVVAVLVVVMVVLAMAALVVATLPVLAIVAVVLSVAPPLLLAPIHCLGSHEGLAERIARRIQLEVVHEKTVMILLTVDGEVELQMADQGCRELDGPAVSALNENRAAGALEVDGLALGNLGDGALESVGNLDIGVAELGRDEEGMCGRDG
jgi:hypothetical protein